MKSLLLAVIFSMVLYSCTVVDTTSEVDPDYKGKSFSKICIRANAQDLKMKKTIEETFEEVFTEYGIEAYSGSQFFPSTREWSDEQIQTTLIDKNIDAYMLITVTDERIDTRINPGTVVTETKGEEKKTSSGKKVYKETSTSHVQGGSEERTYNLSFLAEIFDAKTQAKAWIATTNSSRGEWLGDNYKAMLEDYAENVVETLNKDRLIRIK